MFEQSKSANEIEEVGSGEDLQFIETSMRELGNVLDKNVIFSTSKLIIKTLRAIKLMTGL